MYKKFFPLMLAVLICCSTSMTVFARTEYSHVEENDVSNVSEEPEITNATPLSPEIVIDEPEIVIDYALIASANAKYTEWLFSVPDEIMSASTIELLEYFLESQFMGQQIFSFSSTPRKRKIDFSRHEAFRELISREDFIEALESYAGSILYSSERDELDIAKFEKLLAQPLVKSIISDLPSTAASCPNLQSIYTISEVVTSSIKGYVGSIGAISTANNHDVEVCTPHSELTPSGLLTLIISMIILVTFA